MFQVKLTPTAVHAFKNLHPAIKKQLKDALNTLKDHPYSGKQLREELDFFRSFKIKRYRVIYQIDDKLQHIIVIALGHRRDIYEVATKLLQQEKQERPSGY